MMKKFDGRKANSHSVGRRLKLWGIAACMLLTLLWSAHTWLAVSEPPPAEMNSVEPAAAHQLDEWIRWFKSGNIKIVRVFTLRRLPLLVSDPATASITQTFTLDQTVWLGSTRRVFSRVLLLEGLDRRLSFLLVITEVRPIS
jgi:hypothetical protein